MEEAGEEGDRSTVGNDNSSNGEASCWACSQKPAPENEGSVKEFWQGREQDESYIFKRYYKHHCGDFWS